MQVIQNALSPERSVGDSMQLSVVPSVTNVLVSNDLQVSDGSSSAVSREGQSGDKIIGSWDRV
jgi:hypothetical protein